MPEMPDMTPILLLIPMVTGSGPEVADSIWVNGVFYTVDARFSTVEALAVRGGRIVLAGSRAEVEKLAGAETAVQDLEGRCVTPGLIDSHCHLSALGSYASGRLDLEGARSFEEVLAAVEEAVKKAKPGEWILGGRWDQSLWEGMKFPAHERLSRAAPDNPVWLDRVDGHAGLANARAMELAGITRETEEPPGGEIARDEAGDPTGLFVDNATSLIERQIPGGRLGPEDLILAGQERCLRAGLTGIHDAGLGRREIEAYRKLAGDGRLKLRVHGMVHGSVGPGYFRSRRPEAGERFSLRAVKLMIDGAMGSRGAWLLEPYSDRPADSRGNPYTGLPVQPPELVRAVALAALEGGWQVCTHAIGDRGIRETLDAYEAAIEAAPGKEHRFRIEHAQNPAPADIPRFAALGVIASMQPSHATSDMRWAEARVGPERVKTAYAWRTFLDAGCRIAFGSDFPVENENPLRGIYAAVTRMDREGRPEGGWRPEERITRREAIRAFTIDAAYAAFEEGRAGSLEPGKLADFVVWSRDIAACPPRELLTARPLKVVIAGEVVFEE
jgi:predicted amidohydrolase YtcJ